jgi:hypothetical protein
LLVKEDSGKIMPGHGGVLDRLDSVIFVAPIVFILSNFKLCFMKEPRLFYGIILQQLLLLSDYFIDTMWLQKLLKLVLF